MTHLEDVPALTNDGRPKRWVVVRPRNAQTGILLVRADRAEQVAADVAFLTTPRVQPYGMVVVFLDLEGNRWDLLGPTADT